MSMFLCGIREIIQFDPNDPKSRSVTHQSFAKDANINNIMKKYAKSGVLVDRTLMSSRREPRFGDFSDIPDFGTQLQRIQQAQADFMTLPAIVRAKFDNDVENCLTWLADPANAIEANDLKLLPDDNALVVAARKAIADAKNAADTAATGAGK